MKAINAGIQLNQVGVYDKTKNTILGRVGQRTINDTLVSGPPLNVWKDVFTDAAITPGTGVRHTSNGRVFILSAPVTGVGTIALYTFNSATGVSDYVGKITFALPNSAATTHTIRGFDCDDVGTTNWDLFVLTTGSVLINSGLFVLHKVNLADFTPSGTNIPIATDIPSADQKGVYFLQDPAGVGVGHIMTASAGLTVDKTNKIAYVHNGIAATHQYWVFNYNVAMAVDKKSTVTITIATPGVVTYNAHGFANNDQVTLSTTGALPTGLVAGTVYFVRNAAANTFELSATSGGASINTTGSQSGVHSIGRAFGINSTTGFLHKTGNLPALTGTLIILNSERFAQPAHGHILTLGFDCVVFCTTTNIYVGRLSELTNGAVTWASLNTVNILGPANESVAPTVAQGSWSEVLDSFVYLTNTSTFVVKKLLNNQILSRVGCLSTEYMEGFADIYPAIGFTAVAGMDLGDGWLTVSGNTLGQRGFISFDLRSDAYFDYSMLITPIFVSVGVAARFVATIEELYEDTSNVFLFYRTGPANDAMFDTASGGWAPFNLATDLSVFALDEWVQIKLMWDLATIGGDSAAQIADLIFGYQPDNELSDNWSFSHEHSSSGIPARSTFRLNSLYDTVGFVPPLYFRAFDDDNNLYQSANTVVNAADFEYSDDDGLTWNPLGTIPTSMPHVLHVLLRYNWVTPPGINISVSVRES